MRFIMSKNMTGKQKKSLARILLTALLLIALQFVPGTGTGQMVLYLVPYFLIAYDILGKAAKGIRNGQVFDENFLMAVASIGAFLLRFMTRAVIAWKLLPWCFSIRWGSFLKAMPWAGAAGISAS